MSRPRTTSVKMLASRIRKLREAHAEWNRVKNRPLPVLPDLDSAEVLRSLPLRQTARRPWSTARYSSSKGLGRIVNEILSILDDDDSIVPEAWGLAVAEEVMLS